MTTFEKIAALVAEKIDCPAEDITLETAFADLGIDSLDLAELVMNLEDDLGITLEMSPDLKTVGDIVKKIDENA